MLIQIIFIISFSNLVFYSRLINNKSNRYSRPVSQTQTSQTYVVVATNDLHGVVFPQYLIRNDTKQKYASGGLVYFANMLETIRNQYGNANVLYLDAGDHFQGGIEASLLVSKGKIMYQFYNQMGVNASAIGNHEFDYGKIFLQEYLKNSKQLFLSANIQASNKQTLNKVLPNTKKSFIFNMNDGLKIGVIGITTIDTPATSNSFNNQFKDLVFNDYSKIILQQSNNLKDKGANIIILLAHQGNRCSNQSFETKIWINQTQKNICQESREHYKRITDIINSVPVGTIDAVVQGHEHQIIHQYVNNIPIIGTINDGFYFNLIYLVVNKKSKQLERTLIQGPVPICQKIFQYRKRCDYVPQSQLSKAGPLVFWNFHHKKVSAHLKLSKIFNNWLPKMEQYLEDIFQNEIFLEVNRDQENKLGKLITDLFMKIVPEANFAVLNPGSLRTKWTPGVIQFKHFYKMFPFPNKLQTFELTGSQLKKMFEILQGGAKGFYLTSGLKMKVKNFPRRSLIQIKTDKGQQIIDDKIYTGVTTDFMLNGGDDMRYFINKFYTMRNRKIVGNLKNLLKPIFKQLKVINNNTMINKCDPRLIVI